LLRGPQFDRSTLRQESEQLHQPWPLSGLARFDPTSSEHLRSIRPKQVTKKNERRQTVQIPPPRLKKRPGILGFRVFSQSTNKTTCSMPHRAGQAE
jgi:hypothetical protein